MTVISGSLSSARTSSDFNILAQSNVGTDTEVRNEKCPNFPTLPPIGPFTGASSCGLRSHNHLIIKVYTIATFFTMQLPVIHAMVIELVPGMF